MDFLAAGAAVADFLAAEIWMFERSFVRFFWNCGIIKP